MAPKKVVVIGAGVIGLTTALVLAEKGYAVTIVSENFPGDKDATHYTSSRAGAHFRPFPSFTESAVREHGYTRETQRFFKAFAWAYPESTIKNVKGSDWLEKPGPGYIELDKTYTKDMNNFRVVQHLEKLPDGVTFACSYDTWVLNAPLYVEFLQRLLHVRFAVEFKRHKLTALKDVYSLFGDDGDKISGVVNATGFGLQYDGGYDPATFPIRGQILILRIPHDNPYVNHTVTHQGADGSWTYVLNRPQLGGCVLGGTKALNDWDPTNRPADIAEITKRARKIFPELFVKKVFDAEGNELEEKELDVMATSVGFRPGRHGGSRVEPEWVSAPTTTAAKNDKRLVVHAYGIAGMGFESSYGMAKHAVSILESELDSGAVKPSL